MAEIKSSIEIAMEKTKHLIMSEEEKKEQEKRDLENKIRALLRRLKEKFIEKDDVVKEFNSLRDNNQKRIFVKVALDELSLAEENEEIISVLALIDKDIKLKADTGLKAMKKAFNEELEKREMIMKERIREKLMKMGLQGDALTINVEAWEEWSEAITEVNGIFTRRLEEWKESVIKDLRF
ncbi:MAG: hypothetical protein N2513_03490 [Deltaproteobacteria bacterium]|nr:hypothetical protein [Deltaproteobacteria bacterium]